MSSFVLRYKEKGKSQAIELSRQMYPKKDEDDEEDDEEEDDEEEDDEESRVRRLWQRTTVDK